MDWDLKMPVSWDLVELEHDAVPGIAAAAAAAAASGIGAAAAAMAARGPPSRPECSVDLKLGGLGEFGAPADALKEPAAKGPAASVSASAAAAAAAPSASPLKRPRAAPGGGGGGGGGQCPSCAVDGCKADLSKCRDYHRRHKVCEAHSKTPVVVVSGREMRFCQQCSRFHLLAEFDEAKRSCRKRLDGHNRRRRKPQPDSMNSASFMTNQQGARFATFAPPRPEVSWSGIIKTEESPYYSTTQQMLSSSRQSFMGSASTTSPYSKDHGHGRRFPFLQEGEQISFSTGGATLEISVCQPLLKTVSPAPATAQQPESSSSNKMFSDGGLTQVLDSDCALSLLSSPANSSSVDVGRMVVQPAAEQQHIPMAQPLAPSLQHFGCAAWFACSPASGGAASGFACPSSMESEQQQQPQQLSPVVLVPGSNVDSEMNYHGIFHVAGAEGSSDGTSPSLPFSWQ